MRVLVDTNIWIDHFNRNDDGLVKLLKARTVMAHPLVLGELGCGNLKNRAMILEFFAELPASMDVTVEETLHMVTTRQLHGKGLGLVDCMLLASVLLTPRTMLWTRDKRLAKVAAAVGVGFFS